VKRKEPRWLPRLVVEAIHVDQMREHGGLIGLRDENALESALARPQQRFHYEPETDLATLAAAYAFGLSSNHPFRDGNKRVSFLAAVVFLGLNGLDFVATDEEVVEKSLALAAGELTEADLAEWIQSRIQPTN
jgi:death-on-curing protein